MDPTGYHAVNLLLHIVNAILLYFIARRLFRLAGVDEGADRRTTVIPSVFAALAFAIHPLRVESVAWITERRDMVALSFCLTSAVLYLRASADASRFARWYGLSIVAFVCALLSKATSVTIPAALLILNVFPMRRLGGTAGWWSASARRVYRELAPFVSAAAAVGLMSIVVLRPGPQLPFTEKLAVSAYGFAFYLMKTLAPFNLAPLYERRAPLPVTSGVFIAGYLVSVGAAVAAWSVRRRWPAVTAAFTAFALAMVPLLGIIQNGPQIAADRYTYHAAPALALLFGAVFVLPRWRRPLAFAGASLLIGFAALTSRQSRVWQNSETMWGRVLELDSASYLANNNLGVVLAEQGKTTEAIEHYRRSIRTRPAYADAHNNLGFELAERGELVAAVDEYRTALAIRPAYADAEINWGNVLMRQRQFDRAAQHYATAATIDPERAGTHFNWGLALKAKGDLSGAIDHFRIATTLDPEFMDAAGALSDALDDLQRERRGDPVAR
jgi:tetratricopeptide (TPR) repeat protein